MKKPKNPVEKYKAKLKAKSKEVYTLAPTSNVVTEVISSTPTSPCLKRSTIFEVNQRVKTFIDLLSKGHTRSYLVRYASENYKVTSRQADDYIAKATKELLEINEQSLELIKARLAKRQWGLVQKASDQNDLQVERAVVMDIAKLNGLLTSSVDITVQSKRDPELQSLSDEELARQYGSED